MKYKYNNQWVDLSIKALDSMPVGTQVEYTGTDIPTGWEQVDDYSTDEVDTGKTWIDGKKIYRKVYHNSNYSQSASQTKDVSFSLPNLETITYTYGTIKVSGGTCNLLMSVWANANGTEYSTGYGAITSSGFKITTGSGNPINSANIYIVFEYTKTS